MASEWVRVRANLFTNPRVIRLAARLADGITVTSRNASLLRNGDVTRDVTRNVTRDIAVSCLLRVWAAANEHTPDGVWDGMTPEDLDDIAGWAGFGQAMVAVGWAVFDVENCRLSFPNFLEHNTPEKSASRAAAAERQRKYRERNALRDAQRDVTSDAQRDVTSRVTSAPRIEEKREEENIKQPTNELPLKVVLPTAAPLAGDESGWLAGFVFLTKSGEHWGITADQLAELRQRWPEIDVEHELRALAVWSLDHQQAMPRASDCLGWVRNCLGKKFTEGKFKPTTPLPLPPAARRDPMLEFELQRTELVKQLRKAGKPESAIEAAVAKLEKKILGTTREVATA